MRQGDVLVEGSGAGFQALGAFGQPVHQSYVQLRAAIEQRLGPRYANFFARPQADEHSQRLRWVATVPGKAVRWRDLTPEEQAERALDLQIMRSEFARYLQELAPQLGASSGRSGGEAFAAVLSQALKTPNDGHLYFIGDQPIATFWGFAEEGSTGFEALSVAPAAPAAATVADPAAGYTAGPVESAADAGEVPARRRRWWWWLLPLLLLLLLLLWLLFWWWPRLPEQFGIELPFLPTPPIVEPERPVGPDGRVIERDGVVIERDGVVVGPDGMVIDRDGAVVPGPGAVDGLPEAADPEAEGSAPPLDQPPGQEESGPETPPIPPGDEDPSATEPPVEEPLTEEPPVDEPTAPEVPPAEAPVDPPPDEPSPPASEPPETPTTEPDDPAAGPTPPQGPPLDIPPGQAGSGPADFLEGRWRSRSGLVDQAGRPLDQTYEFDRSGKGRSAIRRGDGVQCSAPAEATMENGRLRVQELENLRCADGEVFERSQTVCTRDAAGRTSCRGAYSGGQGYDVQIERGAP